MEKTAYKIPLSITISRKTGQVTKVEYIKNATLEEFLPFYEWMKEAGEAALAARRQDVDMKGCENAPPRTLPQDVLRAESAADGF